MRNFSAYSRALVASLVLVALSVARTAPAQSQAEGFALERLYLSAPGGGWFVMDDLSMHGGLGGALALTTGYARTPLRVGSGSGRVPVVTDQLFTDFGFAATFDRFRLYLNFDAPLATKGRDGTVSGYDFSAPSLALSTDPDSLADARLGADVRLLGDFDSPLRVGVGVQLLFPTGKRFDFDSDGTYRAVGRALVAGDIGSFSYAGQLGVHVRPLNESPIPDSPRGSELLFGAAGGVRFPVSDRAGAFIVAGPEVFGETAFNSFFGSRSTGVEGLLTARLEAMPRRGALLRLKLGAGGGLDPRFGTPEWRMVGAIEVSDQSGHHDAP